MYKEYFGLSESPFNITPNSRFYFRTRSCNEILKVVQHGIASRKGVMVVTGEPGTGKTLLVKFLERDLGPNVKTVLVQNPHAEFDTMLQVLLTRLELDTGAGDRIAVLDRLTSHLIEQRRQGTVVCLLVDEAQDLDAHTLDEFRLLANLEFGGDALLPIVLIGQPELNLKLDHPSATRIKQRIALTRTTHPLIRMEVGPYIQSRLEVAGYGQTGLFEPEAIDAIAAYSGGIPRLVNSICDNSLIRAYTGKKTVISPEIIHQAARDLRIAAALPFGWQLTRTKWDVTSAFKPQAENADGDPLEEPRAGDSVIAPVQGCAATYTAGPPQAAFAQNETHAIGGNAAANTAFDDQACNESAPKPPATVLGPAEFDGQAATSPAVLPVRLRWYAAGAVTGLALLLLNFISSSPLAVLDSSGSSAPKGFAGDSASYSHPDGEETHGFVEALFVSPSPSTNTAPRRFEIVATQPRDNVVGDRASAPRTTNAKETEAMKTAPAQRSRDGERRRAETADLPADGSRIENAPKTVKVIAGSLLRKRPSASAEIISTLEPGTRVTVVARSGDFYQIRSLDKKPLRGYVHREDAFFERKR
jgi:type II secretory pathway predicted ATPase ExeA